MKCKDILDAKFVRKGMGMKFNDIHYQDVEIMRCRVVINLLGRNFLAYCISSEIVSFTRFNQTTTVQGIVQWFCNGVRNHQIKKIDSEIGRHIIASFPGDEYSRFES
ncbi:hypothetical protein RCL_jg1531.t1 [Rhizophagus clarus]|uniref:Uncharacterized protein n=1 Tax=Rhizophagus clarus TaxID=94130 RepID=A0A8H3L514_9GLOM|nr:hypothetical protein RCL_jg1531.t1 [Rhizophagus clarus]